MKNNDKDSSNWEQLNDITNYVTGNKVLAVKIWKRWLTSIIAVLMAGALVTSIFFIAAAMQSAFNIGDFEEKLPDESVVIDMDKVQIYDSDKSLRLSYFEEEAKKQIFTIIIKNSWWNSALPTDINKYDFTYYDSNSTKPIDINLIQSDGLAQFNLQIKLKKSFFQFKLPVGAEIRNTAKFYEKFMMFNQLEGRFSKHISGRLSIPGTTNYLSEERSHGYLPIIFNYDKAIDNTIIYQTIEANISHFISDHKQEFGNNTHIFPIITTIPLTDININDKTTVDPYLKLINAPQSFYVGNAEKNSSQEYLNLDLYSQLVRAPLFYISYVSNPNLVYDLINLKPTTQEEIISYIKSNPLDYIPFSMVQTAEDNTNTLIRYSPYHFLRATIMASGYAKYDELTLCFALSSSISNGIEAINASSFANVGTLSHFLENKYWQGMYDFALQHRNYFALYYPDTSASANVNWKAVNQSLATFKAYFATALNVPLLSDLTSFTFLDIDHKALKLKSTDSIIPDKIKIIRFHVGKDLQSSNYYPQPHSFNYSFQTKWL